MRDILPPLRLTGATILAPDGLRDRTVAIADGRIARGPFHAVDCSGCWVLPGIVDLHGDTVARRLFAGTDPEGQIATVIGAAARAAVAHGVTTAWLAQDWSWEGGIRSPGFAERVAAALGAFGSRKAADLRLLLRVDCHTAEPDTRLLSLIADHDIQLVLFANAFERRALPPLSDTEGWEALARRLGVAAPDLTAAARRATAGATEARQRLLRLAEAFDRVGVAYGSLSDLDAAARERHAALGARICAFPETAEVAAVAHAIGNPVVLSATDAVAGNRPPGRTCVRTLIAQGRCDALASAGDPPSLAAAAFRLADDGILPLARAWALVSSGPAQIMGLADRGEIAPGRRADLCIIDKATRRVEATISGGRIAWLSARAAQRFRASGMPAAIAAE